MKPSDFLESVMTEPDRKSIVDLSTWREELIRHILKGGIVLGLLGSLAGAVTSFQTGVWTLVSIGLCATVVLSLLLRFKAQIGFRSLVKCLLALLSLVGIAQTPFSPSASILYLGAVPLFGALFLGVRASAACLVFSTVLLYSLGWIFDVPWHSARMNTSASAQHASIAVNFLLVNAVIAISTAVLLRNLSKATRLAVSAHAEVEQAALYDSLTGLPNRRMLFDQLARSITAIERRNHSAAVLFIDLDHFKNVNDTHGHATGDRFLKQAAQRMSDVVRRGDTLARIGGDGFVVILTDLSADLKESARSALLKAETIRAAMEKPFEIDGKSFVLSSSIGISMLNKAETTAHDLLREADTAMYEAKGMGRNRIEFFESSMQTELQSRLDLEHDVALALENNELALAVQSQVDLTGRITGAEVLLRWHHPIRGNVSPIQFIPVAERTGHICAMGNWVLEQACQLVSKLREKGEVIPISVNISPRQFLQADFVEQVKRVIESTQARPSDLVFEVTESLFIADLDEVVSRMNELVKLGIRFSVDDFGTGYSSLSYLKRLPLFELKIDRSFVQELPNDPNDTAIVRMVLAMAAEMRLKVVAEGVESKAHMAFLANHGCDALQGYLFARPEPASSWLRQFESSGLGMAA